jgi:hypothetical protein
LGDKIIRYAQDCYPDYGTRLGAFEISQLTSADYEETELTWNPILWGTGSGWNKSGMHHIDPHKVRDGHWIACVDGRAEVSENSKK